MAVEIKKLVQLRPLVKELLEEERDLDEEAAAKEVIEGTINFLQEQARFNLKAFHKLVDEAWEAVQADFDGG